MGTLNAGCLAVLVTGGAGFIGSHTVDQLLAHGAAVRVLDNLSAGKRENLPSHSRLEFVEADVRDPSAVRRALAGMSHCLHLAAQVSVARSIEDPRRSAEDNVLGFITLLEAARAAGLERLVYASSAAVYGDPASLPLAEDAMARPLSPYGLEKHIDEQYAELYARLHGYSALGLRYFNVYGPRQDPSSPYAGVITLFVDRLRAGRTVSVYGDGRQSRDFIFVADVARANVAALTAEACGAINVATGRRVTLLDLIATLGAVIGHEATPELVAARAGDIVHSAGDPGRMQHELGVCAQTPLVEGLRALLRVGTNAGAGEGSVSPP